MKPKRTHRHEADAAKWLTHEPQPIPRRHRTGVRRLWRKGLVAITTGVIHHRVPVGVKGGSTVVVTRQQIRKYANFI